MTGDILRRATAEALGTAFVLATVIGSGVMAFNLAGGNGAIALLCNTIPTGAILAVLILTFGPVSGAHFNPAVSAAFALRGELPRSVVAISLRVSPSITWTAPDAMGSAVAFRCLIGFSGRPLYGLPRDLRY